MSNIKISYMYRDACNFKEGDSFVLPNIYNLSVEDIQSKLGENVDFDEFIPAALGLTKLGNSTESSYMDGGQDNHPYHSALEFEETLDKVGEDLPDISEVIDNSKYLKEFDAKLLQEAKEYYQAKLDELEKL